MDQPLIQQVIFRRFTPFGAKAELEQTLCWHWDVFVGVLVLDVDRLDRVPFWGLGFRV